MRRRIGDSDVAFDDRGTGPAVVLLPPFPFDRRIFAPNVPALLDAGHRVITLDYPGFGESESLPPSRPLSIAGVAALAAALLDDLAIERAAAVGVSMGGYVALALIRERPERVDALVLADTRATADSAAARAAREQALATIHDRGADVYLSESLPRLLAPGAGAELIALARSLAETRPEALAAGIAALRDRPDRSVEVAAIARPTLVLVGGADQVTPPAEMRAMADTIAGSRFVELPGCGHLSNLERPQEWNEAVVGFLAQTRAAAAGPRRGETP
jgi:3-oxoadipate enol-lactonase